MKSWSSSERDNGKYPITAFVWKSTHHQADKSPRHQNARITNQHSNAFSVSQNWYHLGKLIKSFLCIFNDIDIKHENTIKDEEVNQSL